MDECIVSVIKAMYEDATTKMRMNDGESKAFNSRVGGVSKQIKTQNSLF